MISSFKDKTFEKIANLICGGTQDKTEEYFKYRSSSHLNQFFDDVGTDHIHDGTTRKSWVAGVLKDIFITSPSTHLVPDQFCRVIQVLMDKADAKNESSERQNALEQLNAILARDGVEAFYAEDRICYLRESKTGSVISPKANPHRAFSAEEVSRRSKLSDYLDVCSEDQLIELVLLPLLRQLGYQRVTVAGHKDKSLEYGKDIWMRFQLPTQHMIYFGIQAKKGKLDSSGVTKGSNVNMAEIYNQALMMLGHEIFDPEFNRKVLVDHAYIVSGGEITKAARNWLAGKLDLTKRSQIIFMDKNDILDLATVTKIDPPNRNNISTSKTNYIF